MRTRGVQCSSVQITVQSNHLGSGPAWTCTYMVCTWYVHAWYAHGMYMHVHGMAVTCLYESKSIYTCIYMYIHVWTMYIHVYT